VARRLGRCGDEERARLKARQGVAFVTADPVRVVDASMHDVPRDGETMGEVVMRGNNVMKGYFADEAATAEAFRGGWFHSGDLGVMHPTVTSSFATVRRTSSSPGGENISTIEVERALVRTRTCSRPRSSRSRREVGRAAEGFVHCCRARADRRGADRLRARDAARLQGAERDRVRRAPEDVDRQGQEVRAPRPGQAVTQLSYAHGASDLPLLGEPIGERLRSTVERFGEREALVVGDQGYRATYAELWEQSGRLRAA
jgi:acyl-CoA synthetase (AMP-forming)/AMP-acid ligase II